MAEPTKNQNGDGTDNYGQAAKQISNAAKQAGKQTAKSVAAKGAKATVNAAANTVKAGVKTGKAVANIAAGTAAGGPWGAIISAAWSMRHTLFKVLVSIGLVIVFLVVIIVSLPSIIFENIFGLNEKPVYTTTIETAYADLSNSVYQAVDKGYQAATEEVERIIAEGGYDTEYSMDALVDHAKQSIELDVCYVLAAYSVSVPRQEITQSDMIAKMERVSEDMFPVTYEERQIEVLIPSEQTEANEIKTVRYVACTIHPFDYDYIVKAFGIELDAQYGELNATYSEIIEFTANALKMTLFADNESNQMEEEDSGRKGQ